MKNFVLFFRMDTEAQPSAKQMKKYMADWKIWINEISSSGHLAEGGNHLLPAGKLIKPQNAISEGPYNVNKESIAGFIIIRATDMDEAVIIAQKCPILQGKGTSVEIRETGSQDALNK